MDSNFEGTNMEQWQEIENSPFDMTDEEVMVESIQRISKDTERLTRRNMKDCVSEHIQTLCLEDATFARLTMHPKKSMINCFHYINRKAGEFVEQEMKDNDIKPEKGVYGSDVPDDLCYKWAEDYFRDPDAPEDKDGKEEKIETKPDRGKPVTKTNKIKVDKNKTENKAAEQMSLMDYLTPGQSIGQKVS